jgi:hypothetical protein
MFRFRGLVRHTYSEVLTSSRTRSLTGCHASKLGAGKTARHERPSAFMTRRAVATRDDWETEHTWLTSAPSSS